MNKMAYTPEQLADAEALTRVLASIPPDRRTIITLVTNAFISGMEAQEQLSEPSSATTYVIHAQMSARMNYSDSRLC